MKEISLPIAGTFLQFQLKLLSFLDINMHHVGQYGFHFFKEQHGPSVIMKTLLVMLHLYPPVIIKSNFVTKQVNTYHLMNVCSEDSKFMEFNVLRVLAYKWCSLQRFRDKQLYKRTSPWIGQSFNWWVLASFLFEILQNHTTEWITNVV